MQTRGRVFSLSNASGRSRGRASCTRARIVLTRCAHPAQLALRELDHRARARLLHARSRVWLQLCSVFSSSHAGAPSHARPRLWLRSILLNLCKCTCNPTKCLIFSKTLDYRFMHNSAPFPIQIMLNITS